ncbi:MAG: hypothetical protein R8G66_20520 [Cytophagales bacterium]|nr:hypothetical protein [Cytophagales bacterium]
MKILKWFAIVLVSIVVIIFAAINISSKSLPEGTKGPAAEVLTDKMLNAINADAYEQLNYLEWTFRDGHHFSWNKKDNEVIVKWEDFEVQLNPDELTGEAKKNGVALVGDTKQEAIQTAWAYFANDSFWLVAPYKVRDPGTERSVIETEEGPALLITYTSGGVTPGDSYLWYLDESGKPVAWEMWTSIIPVQGLRTTWEDWKEYKGAWFAPNHQGPGPLAIPLTIHKIE